MDSETLAIEDDADLNQLRTRLRSLSQQADLEDYETTKLVTAASELARNIIEYAEAGEATLEATTDPPSVNVTFVDEGPGIPDPDRALEDGYSGAGSNGLGIGLPGAKRLADEFELDSDPESGTRIRIKIRSTKKSSSTPQPQEEKP